MINPKPALFYSNRIKSRSLERMVWVHKITSSGPQCRDLGREVYHDN